MIHGPMYVIIKWNGSTWIVHHFSLDLDDALQAFLKAYKEYGKDVQLMVDDRVLEIHEMRMECHKLREEVKEVRKNSVQIQLTRLGNTLHPDSEFGGTPELE